MIKTKGMVSWNVEMSSIELKIEWESGQFFSWYWLQLFHAIFATFPYIICSLKVFGR